jgi:NDP-sugar pyrophosphorylase family protein
MLEAHRAARARLSIACVRVPETGRYGRVVVKDGIVVAFAEKGARGSGVINGGSYVIDRNALSGTPDGAFSFESDYLVPRIAELQPAAFMVEDSFLDIGIPEDLARAQALLPCVAA